jgi:phage shock protein B
MSDNFIAMMPFLVGALAILCVFVAKPYFAYLARRDSGFSATDRQLIETLKASSIRLEQRVASLERALLDAESGYAQQRTEV